MAVFAVILIVAVGLCVFDHDNDGVGDEGFDLCVALVAAVATVEMLVIILAAGWSVLEVKSCVSPATPHLPDPPPKLLLLV